MPSGNGSNGHRLSDLNAARMEKHYPVPISITPQDAREMIDIVMRRHGLIPEHFTDRVGWRHIRVGSAHAMAGVIRWDETEDYLVVWSPLLPLPKDAPVPAEFYRMLLQLNCHSTLSAHFSIDDEGVIVGITRPIRGLDYVEVEEAIRAVLAIADVSERWIRGALNNLTGEHTLPLGELPKVKMTPDEAQRVATVLAECDDHGREIFREIMEGWAKHGHELIFSSTGIGLRAAIGNSHQSIGGLRPGVGESRQIAVIGWEDLRKQVAPENLVDRFQADVSAFASPKVTESTAHLLIGEEFTEKDAKALVRALHRLVKEAKPVEKPAFVPDSKLPPMKAKLGPETRRGIQETLQACPEDVQAVYAYLIEGWSRARGTVQCVRPGRIYLKMRTHRHKTGEFTGWARSFNLAVLASPTKTVGATITVAWNMTYVKPGEPHKEGRTSRNFKNKLSKWPGLLAREYEATLPIGSTFTPE